MRDTAILLATYNGEQYLRQQLDSLFGQTSQEFRLVVHDDGSTDSTVDIINEYRDKYPDRIEILYGDSCGGPKENFLWMLGKTEADYYMFCDQDDVWFPEKVKRSVEALEEAEGMIHYEGDEVQPVCVFTDMVVADDNLNNLSDSFIRYIGRLPSNTAYTQILIDNPAAGCTMCFNRQLRDLVVQLEPELDMKNIPMHDALVLEIAAIMGKVVAIDEPLAYYRQTGHNTMGAVTETESDKASRNIQDLKQGSIFEKKKAFVNESRVFAGEIAKAEWLPKDKKNVLLRYSKIGEKGKFKRMSFYSKNNFTRAHHNLWFRLWV
ncbi:rhamnosyltransferase [Pseudobutyrivibrio sp. 49]|uniref:glycosyltransferase family 2 protein n=1 Tax=unclassified Pseudobutyrivibrio TaxID=2638619 RepID=UPI0008904510|nr:MULTISPECIES: glycosyltransferase family 2 protein [unclassified Pseudobutyrivibrio]SDI03569.1 rhamnosyltransferase [Pseudobutyrivibrio sp. 49]SFO24928.1 rhamnosyltransferase [Pseudobutyrivibrio sp. UC1225]